MAQRAEVVHVEGRDQNLAPVVPVRPEGKPPLAARDTPATIKHRAAAGFEGAIDRAARSYLAVAEKSNALLSGVRRWSARVRKENPLQVVAVVAGAAFVLGVVLRLWKSKRYI